MLDRTLRGLDLVQSIAIGGKDSSTNGADHGASRGIGFVIAEAYASQEQTGTHCRNEDGFGGYGSPNVYDVDVSYFSADSLMDSIEALFFNRAAPRP